MKLSASLQIRQSQSLAITPQLLQSIRLLQFDRAELRAFVEREAERNPLLRVADAGSAPARADASRAAAPIRPAAPARSGSVRGVRVAGSGERPSVEDLGSARPSLHAHALAEIADALRGPDERRIAEALLADLDEAGYLRADLDEAARRLGLAPARVAAVLQAIQAEAEPAGLFARDLAECLALQLKRRDRLDPVMACVLANLPLLARRDFAALRRLTGEDESGLLAILSEIRALDPKPGHAFDGSDSPAVIPDVEVWAEGGGAWRLELNEDVMPRVRLGREPGLGAARLTEAERGFLAECRTSANWLLRALDGRRRTVLKVAGEIVRRQDGFLAHGIAHLRPMTLLSVADAVGLHESTVSRVTAGKYIATPRGTFEMKFFFTVAIGATGGGDAHSAESVKHRIRTLVDAEGPNSVLSDDEIAAKLRSEGVDLARRTVAKYREGLGIASSVQRRREMNARRLAS